MKRWLKKGWGIPNVVAKADIRLVGDAAYFPLLLPIALFSLFVSIAQSVESGIIRAERTTQSLLSPNFTLVEIRQTPSATSVRAHDFDFMFDLYERIPQVNMVFATSTEIKIVDPNKGASGKQSAISRRVPVLVVSDGLFRAWRGRTLSGRVFDRHDVLASAPVAVSTAGLNDDLTFAEGENPAKIFVNGMPLDVIGVWNFGDKTLEENHSLILPLSLASWLGDAAAIRFSKVVLEGDPVPAMENLKLAVDRLQLEYGTALNRPTFEMIDAPVTSKNRSLWLRRSGPIELVSILLIVVGVLFTGFSGYRIFISAAPCIDWRILAGHSEQSAFRSLLFSLCLRASLFFLLGAGVAQGVVALFRLRQPHAVALDLSLPFLEARGLILWGGILFAIYLSGLLVRQTRNRPLVAGT
jgi:hypothetical protein